MSIEPKFLLIPKDDYKILCDQSKGNPLIASVFMHINENCSGYPADIRVNYGYCPNHFDGRSCEECLQEAIEDESMDRYDECKKAVVAILREHIDKSSMINFTSDSDGVPIIMQMVLHNCYMQLLREMEEKL